MAHIQKRYIVFIKKREDVDETSFEESHIDADAYNHPALVVRPAALAHEKVYICSLTSFGNQSILERHADLRRHIDYLPIAPSPPNATGPAPLRMRHKKLHKNSYLNVKEVLKVKPAILRPYSRREPADRYQLDAASFKVVVKELIARGQIDRSILRTERRRREYPTPSIDQPLLGTQRDLEVVRDVARVLQAQEAEHRRFQAAARNTVPTYRGSSTTRETEHRRSYADALTTGPARITRPTYYGSVQPARQNPIPVQSGGGGARAAEWSQPQRAAHTVHGRSHGEQRQTTGVYDSSNTSGDSGAASIFGIFAFVAAGYGLYRLIWWLDG